MTKQRQEQQCAYVHAVSEPSAGVGSAVTWVT